MKLLQFTILRVKSRQELKLQRALHEGAGLCEDTGFPEAVKEVFRMPGQATAMAPQILLTRTSRLDVDDLQAAIV